MEFNMFGAFNIYRLHCFISKIRAIFLLNSFLLFCILDDAFCVSYLSFLYTRRAGKISSRILKLNR